MGVTMDFGPQQSVRIQRFQQGDCRRAQMFAGFETGARGRRDPQWGSTALRQPQGSRRPGDPAAQNCGSEGQFGNIPWSGVQLNRVSMLSACPISTNTSPSGEGIRTTKPMRCQTVIIFVIPSQ